MKASTFLFATDLVDEGTDVVLDRLQRSGLDGLTMACNYHHSRDVFPHNPVHRVRFMQGGVFFRPERSKYEDLMIRPDVPGWVVDDDPLEDVCRAANRRGLAVRAWTNNMHSTQRKKLKIPEACICLMSTNLRFKFLICSKMTERSSGTCLYLV